MQARECVFYTACRRQQIDHRALRDENRKATACWAEAVHCDDRKQNMETMCPYFLSARRLERYVPRIVPCL